MFRIRTQFAGTVGVPYLSTMYFDTDGSGGNAQTAANAVGTFWASLIGNMMGGTSYAVEPQAAVVDPITGDVVSSIGISGPSGVSPAGGDPLPYATQALVRWTTGVYIGGRQIRGRTYLPAQLEANNTLGVPTAAYKTTINNAATTLNTMNVPNLVIWSRANGTTAVVSGNEVWSQWAVLRSRRT